MAKKKDLEFGGNDLFSNQEQALEFGSGGDLFASETQDDPIGPIEYPGTADGDTKATLDAVDRTFKARAKTEADRFVAATDSEYWFAVAFETRAQKEAFLKAMQWIKQGDKYLDGVELARLMKIALPPARVPYVAAKPDPKLDPLALPLDS